jgi:hypothetical protein
MQKACLSNQPKYLTVKTSPLEANYIPSEKCHFLTNIDEYDLYDLQIINNVYIDFASSYCGLFQFPKL